jgi:hypothetical protein
MLLALGTVPVAPGTMNAGGFPTALARREAGALRAALALGEGTDGLTVCRGEGGARSRDAGAKAVKRARRVVLAAAQA